MENAYIQVNFFNEHDLCCSPIYYYATRLISLIAIINYKLNETEEFTSGLKARTNVLPEKSWLVIYLAPIKATKCPVYIRDGLRSPLRVGDQQFWKDAIVCVQIYNKCFSGEEINAVKDRCPT